MPGTFGQVLRHTDVFQRCHSRQDMAIFAKPHIYGNPHELPELGLVVDALCLDSIRAGIVFFGKPVNIPIIQWMSPTASLQQSKPLLVRAYIARRCSQTKFL
jgi:hypothetical protein